ncbi:hypothetical protein RIF29_26636 [Crotalaria pallida]|uniref:Uncharacterized protein n=1 Tax=Crotalaria pallida TaxID=3830 RepID=A0AAN9EV81_CROPI
MLGVSSFYSISSFVWLELPLFPPPLLNMHICLAQIRFFVFFYWYRGFVFLLLAWISNHRFPLCAGGVVIAGVVVVVAIITGAWVLILLLGKCVLSGRGLKRARFDLNGDCSPGGGRVSYGILFDGCRRDVVNVKHSFDLNSSPAYSLFVVDCFVVDGDIGVRSSFEVGSSSRCQIQADVCGDGDDFVVDDLDEVEEDNEFCEDMKVNHAWR